MTVIDPPLALLAELTHRCPLRCAYCANPLQLEPASNELGTDSWFRIFDEAAAIGILQVHFSGGEPTARRDLVPLVRHAATLGLYGNLITSGIAIGPGLLEGLAEAGLEHVQLSIQGADHETADRMAGRRGAQAEKRLFAEKVRAAGLALTLNVVLHRGNLDQLPAIIDLAESLQASRLELANTQYYGWALLNREALLPPVAQLEAASTIVAEARKRLCGRVLIDYVPADYFGGTAKACMGGWGRKFICVTPSGTVLPCHAAQTIRDLAFPSIKDSSLSDIWLKSEAFNRFRGTAWMPEPCRSCERREIDWGGCRCQALAVAGDSYAADPVCRDSPHRPEVDRLLQSTRAESLHYRGRLLSPAPQRRSLR